ncbi:MAG: GMC family oxidoreductase N-terminal domain-containing protein [Pseudomonadota bacterium]
MSASKTAPSDRFDYVIIGGGSAGCVLADRLSASGEHSVCLIEAGPPDRDPRIKVPFGLIGLMNNPRYDWRYRSADHAHLGGKSVSVPRGKTLGGSGSINSMVYIRGRASDYDRWAELGATGWAWDDVLPIFKRQENNGRGADAFHGDDGPLHVQNAPSPHPLTETFIRAGEENQIPSNSDFNGAIQEGLGVYQTNMRNGRRWSAADAFLRPAMRRQNLAVFTNTDADRLVLEDGRATSIEVVRNQRRETIRVRGEVILAAGAVGSPAILLRSGIGPGGHLQDLGIETRNDLSGVGANLHDHPAVAVFHGDGPAGYGITLSAIPQLIAAPFQYLFSRRGMLASNTVEAGGFAKTDPGLAEPDVQFHFIPARLGHEGKMIVYGRGYYCDVCLLKPKSRGALRLSSRALNASPIIDLNLLKYKTDFDTLTNGLKLLRSIMAAPGFNRFRSEELCPGRSVISEAEVRTYIVERLGTAYHPVGTCRMGDPNDPYTVVDPRLRVKNMANVRVVDASVMPEIVAGNTNAPTMMIAEKGADIIRAAVR